MYYDIKILKTERVKEGERETDRTITIYEQRIDGEFDPKKIIAVVNDLQQISKQA